MGIKQRGNAFCGILLYFANFKKQMDTGTCNIYFGLYILLSQATFLVDTPSYIENQF